MACGIPHRSRVRFMVTLLPGPGGPANSQKVAGDAEAE
jgi:hypothetical protein